MILTKIPLNKIKPSPYQTRNDFAKIATLAKNMDENGLQNPPTVRTKENGDFELVSGARRVAAAKLLGWTSIDCFVRVLTDDEALALCISENLQREDLNPIEEAHAFLILQKRNKKHREIAEIAGKSTSYITNSLSLLKMDPFLQACIIVKKLSISHVRVLNKLPRYVLKYQVADIAIDWSMPIKELDRLVTSIRNGDPILHWKRTVPISKIIIQSDLLNSGHINNTGCIILDTTYSVIGGLRTLVQARNSGKTQVEVDVVYHLDYLNPENWTPDPSPPSNSPPFTSFERILAQMLGGVEGMWARYPVHRVNRTGEAFTLQPVAQKTLSVSITY